MASTGGNNDESDSEGTLVRGKPGTVYADRFNDRAPEGRLLELKEQNLCDDHLCD